MVSLWEKQRRSIRTRTQEKKVALVILNNICGLMSHAPSRTGVVSNRLEKSLRGVEHLVITPMQCIYCTLFLRVSFRILENLDTVFGRLPCFWVYTLSVYNYSKDGQVQHLRVTEFVQNDVMPLGQWLTPCFYVQVTLHIYIHLTQETCCVCIGWLNR